MAIRVIAYLGCYVGESARREVYTPGSWGMGPKGQAWTEHWLTIPFFCTLPPDGRTDENITCPGCGKTVRVELRAGTRSWKQAKVSMCGWLLFSGAPLLFLGLGLMGAYPALGQWAYVLFGVFACMAVAGILTVIVSNSVIPPYDPGGIGIVGNEFLEREKHKAIRQFVEEGTPVFNRIASQALSLLPGHSADERPAL